MNEPMSQEDFELASAECEGVKVSTIKAWRKSTGGYSNEKIDDMYLGYSLATVALEKQKAITRRVSAESNRLFDEKAVLIKQLEAAERERDELKERLSLVRDQRDAELNKNLQLEAKLARRDAAAGEPVAWQFYDDGSWHNGSNHNNHRENTEKAGYRIRELFPAAPRAVLPPEWEGNEHSEYYIGKKDGWNECLDESLKLGAQPQKPVAWHNYQWRETPKGWVWWLSESFAPKKKSGDGWKSIAVYLSEEPPAGAEGLPILHAANVKWEVKK